MLALRSTVMNKSHNDRGDVVTAAKTQSQVADLLCGLFRSLAHLKRFSVEQ